MTKVDDLEMWDWPNCFNCGWTMVPDDNQWVCENCGAYRLPDAIDHRLMVEKDHGA